MLQQAKFKEKIMQFDIQISDKSEEFFCPRIVDYPNVLKNNYIIVPKKGTLDLVTSFNLIQIFFDYPLSNPTTIAFESSLGFTLLDFFRCVYEGYNKIYDAENDPGEIPGMANRSKSVGPYGIWGHYLEDLFLEGFYEVEPGKYRLSMGS